MVEAGILLPMLLVLLLGVWEVGRLVEVTQLVHNAAREAGRQASAGNKTMAEVEADALRYLQYAGVRTTGASVTVTNMTGSADTPPKDAAQLDRYQVTVAVPFNNIPWIVMRRITSVTSISATSEWYSMNDIPVTVPNRLPME
jgi:Flp pilus assembly protein TadG